eukprot:70891-Rhodomonas_salina.3
MPEPGSHLTIRVDCLVGKADFFADLSPWSSDHRAPDVAVPLICVYPEYMYAFRFRGVPVEVLVVLWDSHMGVVGDEQLHHPIICHVLNPRGVTALARGVPTFEEGSAHYAFCAHLGSGYNHLVAHRRNVAERGRWARHVLRSGGTSTLCAAATIPRHLEFALQPSDQR